MDLLALGVAATEMKTLASEHPMELGDMLKGISTVTFPPGLKRVLDIEGAQVQIQFSHDRLSPGKYIKHLSFSRVDHEILDERIKQNIKQAFFGDAEVMSLPSLHGPAVVQMGQLVAG